MRKFGMILFVMIITVSLTAQESKPATTEKKEDKTEHKKTEEKKPDKPVKFDNEEGTVQIDPQNASETLKITNIRMLKKLRSAILNMGATDKFSQHSTSFVEASTALQEKKFLQARRKFESNLKALADECRTLSQAYREKYAKLLSESSKPLMEKKLSTNTPGDQSQSYLNTSLDKHLGNAVEFYRSAETAATLPNACDSIHSYRQSIWNLIMIQYNINKEKSKHLTTLERLKNNLLIDDDFVPAEYKKEFDDSLEYEFSAREKEREKERNTVKRIIAHRYGNLDKLAKDHEEKQSADNKDKTPVEKAPDKGKEQNPSSPEKK